jgi:trafficking protein particle complex subunit 11
VLVNTSFIFVAGEGHVGEPIQAQLKIFSEAHQNTAPVTFSRIRCQFKQNRYELEISHSGDESAARPPSAQSSTGLSRVEIVNLANRRSHETDDDGRIVFKSKANLVFHPGRRVVFIVAFDFKEPGEIELEYLISEIETPEFHVIHTSRPTHFARPLEWLGDSDDGPLRKRMTREEPWSADIRPKPPKLDVKILDLERSMYTDEPIKIEFQITNGEEEEVSATLDVRILTRGTSPEIAWIHSEESEPPSDSEGDAASSSRSLSLPPMAVGQSLTRTAIFTAPSRAEELILESKLHYFLPSDPEVPLSKTFTTNLSINSPFEANYEFSPHAHPDPWPSFFSASSPIPGLLQRWSLTASVASFASETLILHKAAFEIDKKPSALECSIISGVADDGTEVHPRTMRHFNFVFDTTRSSAKEHRTMSMTTKLAISWSRPDKDATVITSTLPVSPLQLPPIEPRVVAMTKPMPTKSDTAASAHLTWLTLFMENPTSHPLTFDITVPSSDSVAFSGPKQQAVTILPYSRTEVDFRLLPLVRAAWVVFGVKVTDRYFAREVEVLAGEGLEANEDGGVKWWVE